ncbi:MAG: LysM peptidoglycan-binding domain-containing protein [Phycisphaerales bacterium]|nr:LysM peptidoglycan-binding domain-containing protein [Phycisphaerales bacterium]
MEHHGGKIAAGLLCLVVVWIIVFWLWTPTEGKISFSTADGSKAEQPADDVIARPKLPNVVADPGLSKPAVQPAPLDTRPGPRAVTGGVVAPEFEDYTVQPGETFASIALKFLGSRSKADVIASANPLVDPTRIRAGRVIRIPRDPANIQGKPTTRAPTPPRSDGSAPAGARTHTVEKGDTLTGISQKYYGTIKRIDLILKANRNVLNRAEDLRPGQVLQIPAAPL